MDFILHRLTQIVKNLVVYPKQMNENLNKFKGLIFSQQILMKLTTAGMKRQSAYDLVQRNALRVWDSNMEFKTLLLEDNQIRKYLTETEIKEIFSVDYHLKYVEDIFDRVFI